MTKEEAIKNIKEHCYFANLIPQAKEALDIAIKALDSVQCSCDKCVSMKDVDDAIYEFTRSQDVSYGEIMEYLEKLPSVQPSSWINVKDRLPEDGEKVVVTLEDGDACTMTFYRSENDWWFEMDEGWEYKDMARAWVPSYREDK